MTHHVALLPGPLPVKIPGSRVQRLGCAVLCGAKVVAVFAEEKHAEAYAWRLNQLQRERIRA
jgi:hypothetical protein